MNKLKLPKLANDNSWLVLFAFVITVIFQMTAYKFIWDIEWVSRPLNIAYITIFSGYAINTLSKLKFNQNVICFFVIPGLLVYIGFFINITIGSVLNINVINQYGALIPWAIYLAIPGLVKFGKLDASSLWRYLHYFMLTTVSISIIEYYLLFSGVITARSIVTSGGDFVAGYFSMLYALETGEFHYRLYAAFMEPGTLAMLLLPVMAYAFLYRKYFSLAIYAVAMYMSGSLGGFIGVAMLIPLLINFRYHKTSSFAIAFSLLATILIVSFFSNYLFEEYNNRGESREVRIKNTSGFVENIPRLLLEHPFGLSLTENTEQARKNPLFVGTNFAPGNAYYLGGILSFLGYLAILFVSLWYAIASLFRKGHSLDEQAAVVSIIVLMPFIFQRMALLDSSIFALLFAPFVIKFLQGASRMRRTGLPNQLTTEPTLKNRTAG